MTTHTVEPVVTETVTYTPHQDVYIDESKEVPNVAEEETFAEEENYADRIPDSYDIYLDNEKINYTLSDNNRYTMRYISSDQRLYLQSEKPFGSLYIEFGSRAGMPTDYKICWDGGSINCSNEVFLHDYVRLSEEVNEAWFEFGDDFSVSICELQLFTAGSAPYGVQDWQAPCEEADILVFPTHADDDVLFFGPIIAYYSIEEELKVQTAFMVDHSKSKPIRDHERLDGLWEMGVRYYPIIGSAPDTAEYYFDAAMQYYKDANIPSWQVEQIRRFRPLVIVGHDLNGEYGNGGHKVNAHYLIQSVEWSGDSSFYPESADIYGVWDTPKLYLHYCSENNWLFDVNTPLSKDPSGRTAFEIIEDAFAHHSSQHVHTLGPRQYDDELNYDCRPFGLYRSLVGNDSCADVMNNIDVQKWR